MLDSHNRHTKEVWVLLGIGVLVRLFLFVRLHPLLVDPSYTDAARNILQLHFRALGDRTPLYPMLLAVCGVNYEAVWIAQSFLGIAVSLMIFDMALRHTHRGSVALIVALACSLIRDVLIYESYIATETLAAFLVVTSLWLVARADGTGESKMWYPLGVGATLALGGLNRPLMLCLIPVYYCFMVPIWPLANILRPESIKKTLLFALPVIVFVFGWCGFNYFNSGFFSPTTRAGQQLMDQTTPYVELAPDKFAVLRDVWLKNRQHPHDVQEELFEESLPEIESRTGKSRAEVSRELTHLALYLEVHHPLLCLRRAEDGWLQFWGTASPAETQWPQETRLGVTGFIGPLAEFLVRETMGCFLLLALISFPCGFFRLRVFTKFEYLVFAIVLWVSVFAALTEFGDNNRFSLPFLPVIMYVVLTWSWKCVTSISTKIHAPSG